MNKNYMDMYTSLFKVRNVCDTLTAYITRINDLNV